MKVLLLGFVFFSSFYVSASEQCPSKTEASAQNSWIKKIVEQANWINIFKKADGANGQQTLDLLMTCRSSLKSESFNKCTDDLLTLLKYQPWKRNPAGSVMGLTISDKEYEKEAERLIGPQYFPPPLREPDALAELSVVTLQKPETYKRFIERIGKVNASLAENEKWKAIAFYPTQLAGESPSDLSAQERVQFTPGPNESQDQARQKEVKLDAHLHNFGRTIIYIPSAYFEKMKKTEPAVEVRDLYIQVGSHPTGGYSSHQLASLAVRTNEQTKQKNFYMANHWMEDSHKYTSFSKFTPCLNCHTGGPMAIHPMKRDSAGRVVNGEVIAFAGAESPQKTLDAINRSIKENSSTHPHQYPNPFPNINVGQPDPEHRTTAYLKKCAPGLPEGSLTNIASAINCAACHKQSGKPRFSVPFSSAFFDKHEIPLSFLVNHDFMPPNGKLAPLEKKGLLDCLKQITQDQLKSKVTSISCAAK